MSKRFLENRLIRIEKKKKKKKKTSAKDFIELPSLTMDQ